jgi:hypothetical protein
MKEFLPLIAVFTIALYMLVYIHSDDSEGRQEVVLSSTFETLKYVEDKETHLCFATLISKSYGKQGRVVSFTNVPCEAVKGRV